ncbi:MAG: rRNA (pseudouridine1915-N3)-methyltransferase [Patescibacteria group bacterium]|nr:23S rRNA (pseudouridine(1915)-N(3))-methyltransferase RlmH [Candidatus Saccharibacteria bacterium]MDQ5963211.1 rRNA (pseudouridine1915-N3)-methyltransferase [Patescibacteria group bacterium]
MKIHFVTVGKPKLSYAIEGVREYSVRLGRLHSLRTTHIADKSAYDATKIAEILGGSTVVILEITGQSYTSEQLAEFLEKRELESREVSFVIGGPEGLPQEIRDAAAFAWSIGRHTLPHDLAMVVTLEALYRASTIDARLPYHK